MNILKWMTNYNNVALDYGSTFMTVWTWRNTVKFVKKDARQRAIRKFDNELKEAL